MKSIIDPDMESRALALSDPIHFPTVGLKVLPSRCILERSHLVSMTTQVLRAHTAPGQATRACVAAAHDVSLRRRRVPGAPPPESSQLPSTLVLGLLPRVFESPQKRAFVSLCACKAYTARALTPTPCCYAFHLAAQAFLLDHQKTDECVSLLRSHGPPSRPLPSPRLPSPPTPQSAPPNPCALFFPFQTEIECGRIQAGSPPSYENIEWVGTAAEFAQLHENAYAVSLWSFVLENALQDLEIQSSGSSSVLDLLCKRSSTRVLYSTSGMLGMLHTGCRYSKSSAKMLRQFGCPHKLTNKQTNKLTTTLPLPPRHDRAAPQGARLAAAGGAGAAARRGPRGGLGSYTPYTVHGWSGVPSYSALSSHVC